MTRLPAGYPGIVDFNGDVERLENGNTLIADGGDETEAGSEILEINPAGQVVWRYGDGLVFAHSAKRLPKGNTLITDTTNDRVLEVSPEGKVVFTSECWDGGSGSLSDGSHLDYPNDAHQLDNGNLLITDRNNNRCLITDRKGNLHWSYTEAVDHPHNCDPTPDGTFMIASSNGDKVLEVNREKEVVWSYGDAEGEDLFWPRDADRLDNGNTLITDSRNSRIIEVTPEGKITWKYEPNHFANFYEADKLKNGNVLISDQQHKKILEVDKSRNVVWSFRNYRRPRPIYESLQNGSFSFKSNGKSPSCWTLSRRLSEGGGRMSRAEDDNIGSHLCLEYDRPGILYLLQTVSVEGGNNYRMSSWVKTRGLTGGAAGFLQVAFEDELGGRVGPAPESPQGTIFAGDNDWTKDSFEAQAPSEARAAEVRVSITGKGTIGVKDLQFEPA